MCESRYKHYSETVRVTNTTVAYIMNGIEKCTLYSAYNKTIDGE